MNVITIKPFGFCSGVDNAIKIALEAKEENPTNNVYILGMLVHNEDVISFLKNKGLIILDEKKDSLENLLKEIPPYSVLVFSAHGHPSSLEQIAISKNLKTYDATCKYVKENMKLGKDNKNIIYVGVKGHLESEAFIKENPHAVFFNLQNNSCDFSLLEVKNPKIISQTTISYLELESAFKLIKKRIPEAEILAERCSSTTLRQKEILNLDKEIETLIVLGSQTSNNSKKLAELGSFRGIKTFLCSNIEDVKKLNLDGIKKVALASGASTSRETFLEVATYLEKLN